MGAFCGAVHVKTTDVNAILECIQKMCKKKQATSLSFYISRPRNGWITIYPSNHGQDERVSTSISRRLKEITVHPIVHDDDVFTYFTYKGGRLVDRFSSNPDYFAPASSAYKRKFRGDPEKLRFLLASEDDLHRLHDLLDFSRSERCRLASEALRRFSAVLGLPNTPESYEAIKLSQGENPENFSELIHLSNDDAVWSALHDILRDGHQCVWRKNSMVGFHIMENVRERVLSLFGESSREAAIVEEDLGDIYSGIGDHTSAEASYFKSLEILNTLEVTEEVVGRINIKYARIGNCYASQEKFDEAEYWLQQAIDLSLQINGKDHLFHLGYMKDMASIYSLQGKTDLLQEMQEQIVECLSSVFSASTRFAELDFETGINNSLAEGKYDEAESACTFLVFMFSMHVDSCGAALKGSIYEKSLLALEEIYDRTGHERRLAEVRERLWALAPGAET